MTRLVLLALLAASASASAQPLHPCVVGADSLVARCGFVSVPEDRTAQVGRVLDLAVVVVPAESDAPQPEPLFVLAGGPGQTGAELVDAVAGPLAAIHRTRDVVLIDPRGSGGSNPLLCPGASADVGYGPGEDATWSACLDALAAHADLQRYATADLADDVEAVRVALGYDQIHLFGGSYGTRVAQAVLRRHTGPVRSAVLWAVAPPGYRIPLDGGLAVQAALDRLFAACAADADCGSAYPRLAERFDALLVRLMEDPVDVPGADGDTLQIDADLFAQSLIALLTDARQLRAIPRLIDQADRGDWRTIAAVASQVVAGAAESPEGLYLSVVCSEDVAGADPARLGAFHGPLGDLLRASAEDIAYRCDRWPATALGAEALRPLQTDVPVLLLSGEADPATPPEGARRLADMLPSARAVEVPATSHGPLLPGCLGERIAAFLDAPDPDALDLDCVADLEWPSWAPAAPPQTGPSRG